MKIENKAVKQRARRSDEFHDFLNTLKRLEPGQSFVIGFWSSNYRNAITIAENLLDREFCSAQEGEKLRIGRTS